MGKYQSLNILNIKNRKDYMSDDCIQDVANMINASGQNRSQRRRLEKTLGKVETIMEHTQSHVDRSAYAEYQKAVDQNFLHFFAILGLTMLEDYRWEETEENDHGQITSLFQRVDKKIKKYAEMGYTTEELVGLLDEKTGILLVPDSHEHK